MKERVKERNGNDEIEGLSELRGIHVDKLLA